MTSDRTGKKSSTLAVAASMTTQSLETREYFSRYYPIPPTEEEVLDILDALEATQGNYAMAARRLNRSRNWMMQRVAASITLQEGIDEIRESIVDNCQSALVIKATAGDFMSIKKIVDTWGRSRGLVEKQEVEVTQKQETPAELEVKLAGQLSNLTPEQIRALAGLE